MKSLMAVRDKIAITGIRPRYLLKAKRAGIQFIPVKMCVENLQEIIVVLNMMVKSYLQYVILKRVTIFRILPKKLTHNNAEVDVGPHKIREIRYKT